jgi:hypothetical protein
MANRKHLAKLKEGVEAWNEWRQKNPTVRVDLEGAGIGVVNLSGADLSGADLRHVNLNMANLGGANLAQANFGAADLLGAKFRGADLRGADLNSANLRGADLRGADLVGAKLWETVFAETDLREVRGLDTCVHFGPSVIDHRTLVMSWPLPLKFLRGCGLPDALIDYLPSLLNQPIQFYSCFISYSTNDQEFADRLYADLQNKGVRCWFAPHDIQAGKKIHEQIDEAIRRYERLLLILSTNSMKSPWVKTEIRKARRREIEEKRRVLFPVSIVPFTNIRTWESFYADEGIDLAEEIREYYIPDFSNWKNHDSYTEGLKKLLDGLKAEGSKAA